MSTPRSNAIPLVLRQHAEDAAMLHSIRTRLTHAPHVKLQRLERFDQRLDAHLDGLAVAGADALPLLAASLEDSSTGTLFAATVHAIVSSRGGGPLSLDRLLALAQTSDEARRGILSALGWVEPANLRGVVAELLASSTPSRRLAGVAACAMHRVDPGLARLFTDPDATVRARAWRTAGEIGKREFVSAAAAATADADPGCRFWAAWAAVLLGDNNEAVEVLAATGIAPGPFRAKAFQMALHAMVLQNAHGLLAGLARDPANLRWVIRGAGLAGDPVYVPWLIDQMADRATARLAGEAFGLLTGLDLPLLDFEVKPPEGFESGPTDEPDDRDVGMDEDDDLPWPDVVKIKGWWGLNADRFPAGNRFLLGKPRDRATCLHALRDGYQRQRIAAAWQLSLLNPGNPLFDCSAPAWRQRRLLGQLS